MSPAALHTLLLLADSALPLGSFAFSSGLESFLAHHRPAATSTSQVQPSTNSYATPFTLLPALPYPMSSPAIAPRTSSTSSTTTSTPAHPAPSSAAPVLPKAALCSPSGIAVSRPPTMSPRKTPPPPTASPRSPHSRPPYALQPAPPSSRLAPISPRCGAC